MKKVLQQVARKAAKTNRKQKLRKRSRRKKGIKLKRTRRTIKLRKRPLRKLKRLTRKVKILRSRRSKSLRSTPPGEAAASSYYRCSVSLWTGRCSAHFVSRDEAKALGHRADIE